MNKSETETPHPAPSLPAPPAAWRTKLFYTMEESAQLLNMGRTGMFKLANEGLLRTTKVASKTLVASSDLEACALLLQQGAFGGSHRFNQIDKEA